MNVIVPGTKEWHEFRATGIGGSETAAIMGMNPFSSPMDVWLRKVGLVGAFEGNEATEIGNDFEPVMVDWFARKHGDEFYVEDSQPMRHPEFEYIIGTPDRFLCDVNDTKVRKAILEVKTTGIAGPGGGRYWGDDGTDDIPEHVIIQVAQYMMIANLPVAHIAALIGGRGRCKFVVERSAELEEAIVEACTDFWNNYVLPKVEPPMDSSDATKRWLGKKFSKSSGSYRVASEVTNIAMSSLRDARDAKKTAEEDYNLLANELMLIIGQDDGIEGEVGKIHYRFNKDSTTTSWKSLCATLMKRVRDGNLIARTVLDDMVAEHTVVKPGVRTFRPFFNPEVK